MTKQFLLQQWVCDCGYQFYTKGFPEDLISCPSCGETEYLGDGETVVAERWGGKELV